MSPVLGPTREDALRALRSFRSSSKLPITFADGAPASVLRREEGVYRLRRLEVDRAAADADRSAREAAGDRNWMPEHEWRHLKPTMVLLEAESAKAMAKLLENFRGWPPR